MAQFTDFTSLLCQSFHFNQPGSLCRAALILAIALLPKCLLPSHYFTACSGPLRLWLYVVYAVPWCFVAMLKIGGWAESGRDFWFVAPRTPIGKGAYTITWTVLLPCLVLWTFLGVRWLIDSIEHTPECFPYADTEQHGGFPALIALIQIGGFPALIALIQMFCTAAILGYAIFVANVWHAAACLRSNSMALGAIEDEDLVQRWGVQKPSSTQEISGGLSASALATLPRHISISGDGKCAVCLEVCEVGDHVRQLPGCSHIYHRPCIDLWLLRSSKCPLCNATVHVAATEH